MGKNLIKKMVLMLKISGGILNKKRFDKLKCTIKIKYLNQFLLSIIVFQI